jgi:hypothetical protein
VKTPTKKPIRLKPSVREIEAMQADLEGRSPSCRAKTARAIWTREFLASGRFGKM